MKRTRGRSAARSIAVDLSPLTESPAYRAAWIGQAFSLIGTNIRLVAVPWQIFELTGSVVAVGLIGLAEVGPLVVFSILGGPIADRAERRALLGRMQLGMLAAAAALSLFAFMGRPSIVLIYVLVALASTFSAIERPARRAMIPSIVPEGKLAAAVAVEQVAYQTTHIVGPAVGGLLLASVAIGWVYGAVCLTHVGGLVALRWLPRSRPKVIAEQHPLEAVKEGLAFAFRSPLILSIFVIDLIAMIFGMPRAVFPALATGVFDSGARVAGLLYAAPAAGALVGALASGWVRNVRRQGVAVIVAVGVWGAAIALAGMALFSLVLTLVLLAVAGAADVVSAVFRGTMLLEATPDHLRGRVSALNLMVVNGGPRIGDVEAGLVAGVVGAPASVVIGGLACLAGTIALSSLSSPLRRYRSPTLRAE